jgi:uncharacterized membrane protein YkgB
MRAWGAHHLGNALYLLVVTVVFAKLGFYKWAFTSALKFTKFVQEAFLLGIIYYSVIFYASLFSGRLYGIINIAQTVNQTNF